MKKLVIAALLVAFAAMPALAGKVVTYENAMGNVEFDHGMHMKVVEGSCKNAACHGDSKPGPIEINKEKAHSKMCKTCHQESGGPTGCKNCHKK